MTGFRIRLAATIIGAAILPMLLTSCVSSDSNNAIPATLTPSASSLVKVSVEVSITSGPSNASSDTVQNYNISVQDAEGITRANATMTSGANFTFAKGVSIPSNAANYVTVKIVKTGANARNICMVTTSKIYTTVHAIYDGKTCKI